ncbi:MAG: hypothetical protein ABWY11_10365 [Umezawaea sp.]
MSTTPQETGSRPDEDGTKGPAAPDRELSSDDADEPAVLTPATEDPE